MATGTTVIEARNVIKVLGSHTVVNGIHLKMNKAECFGIIGPSGSGKTSLLKMMYCHSPLTSGELFVLGLNVRQNARKIKAQLGVVPQEGGWDSDLSAIDNLLVYAHHFQIPLAQARTYAREWLRFMHLEDYENHQMNHLELEIKKRLSMTRALLNRPKVLFMDDLTSQLEPQQCDNIYESLTQLRNSGYSMVLASRSVKAAEQLCHRVVLIHRGQLLCEGNPQELIERYVGKEVIEFELNREEMDYYIEKIKKNFEYQVINHRLRIFIKVGQEGRPLLSLIESQHILIRKASLEDVFLLLAGIELNPRGFNGN